MNQIVKKPHFRHRKVNLKMPAIFDFEKKNARDKVSSTAKVKVYPLNTPLHYQRYLTPQI